jgi:prophage tail gpP-like protein
MSDTTEHRVTVRAGKRLIENWTSYDVSADMLQPADQFALQLGPADPIGQEFGKIWKAVAPDTLVEILLDDVPIMTGYIDDRSGSSDAGGDTIAINGRDKAGRLVDESMPLVGFNGLSIQDLALVVGSPWFTRVDLSNDTNRKLVIGAGRGAKGGRVMKDPDRTRGDVRYYRKVEPGETRWNVLSHFLHENDMLAWAAADGQTLIIGQANHNQAPTFYFFNAAEGSRRQAQANCASFRVMESVGERYSQIITMGSNAGSAKDYGEKVTKRKGVASDGPGLKGIGKDFSHRKILLLADDAIKDDGQAQTRAVREMRERDAKGHEIQLTVFGHSQQRADARAPSLYAFDTVAFVESEVFDIHGLYLITSVRFHRDRANGETTELTLVPKGTLLTA